ncbi:unnamed protein product [Auanema sp. JU1783]|nr:unnamed protein product [Auanema sp. JU1783]
MSNHKKKGEKKAQANANKQNKPPPPEEEEFPEPLELVDDGTISERDCVEFSKLLLASNKPLNRTASLFLETFQNRFVLSVGVSLTTLHDLFDSVSEKCEKVVQIRIVLMFLIYKSRDLDPFLKRKPDKSDPKGKDIITGHPFIEFFIGGYEEKSSKSEVYMCAKILERKGSELGLMTPIDIMKTAETANLESDAPAAVSMSLFMNRMRWPMGYEESLYPGYVTDCDEKPLVDISSITVDDMTRICVNLLLKKTETAPLQDLGTYELFSFIEATKHELDHNPRDDNNVGNFDVVDVDYDEDAPVQKKKENESPEELLARCEAHIGQKLTLEPQTVLTETKQEASVEDQQDMISIQKILKGQSLSPVELRALMKRFKDCSEDDPLLDSLKNLEGIALKKFVGENVKIASDIAYKTVSKYPDCLITYMKILSDMDVSVQNLELVRRLYENIPGLQPDLLREFVYSVMDSCQKTNVSSSQLARNVRMICMFMTSLMKHGLLRDNTVLSGVQAFLLKFGDVKEATLLYQYIVKDMKSLLDQ